MVVVVENADRGYEWSRNAPTSHTHTHTGAQLRLPLEGHKGRRSLARLGEWVSVGGGGGCGTTDADQTTIISTSNTSPSIEQEQPHILCGRQLDANAAVRGDDAAASSSLSAERLTAALRWCRREEYEVRIQGGGGGGGGTAECCEAFSMGYGFSFRLVKAGRVVDTAAADMDDDGLSEGEGEAEEQEEQQQVSSAAQHGGRRRRRRRRGEGQRHQHHGGNHHRGGGRVLEEEAAGGKEPEGGAVPRDAIEAQLRYDPLFRFLFNASQACPGGFQSWCCGACCFAARKGPGRTDMHRERQADV